MTSFTKTRPLCGTFFWRRVELSPGSVFVLENADRHGGLILKIPCKTPKIVVLKKSTNPGLPLAMWDQKHLKKSSFFFTKKKKLILRTILKRDFSTFLYIKSQLFYGFFWGHPIFSLPQKVATSANFQIQNSHHWTMLPLPRASYRTNMFEKLKQTYHIKQAPGRLAAEVTRFVRWSQIRDTFV